MQHFEKVHLFCDVDHIFEILFEFRLIFSQKYPVFKKYKLLADEHFASSMNLYKMNLLPKFLLQANKYA